MGKLKDLVEYQRIRRQEDLAFEKAKFIDDHFPPDVIRNLRKVGFFTQKKPTHEQIEARVCQFFGLDSIFDYANIGEGAGVHVTLTKKGIKQATQHDD